MESFSPARRGEGAACVPAGVRSLPCRRAASSGAGFPDERRVCAAGNARVKSPSGKIPLLSAGTAGGAGGTEQEQGFAEQLRKDGGDALDAGAAVWGGLGGWGGLVAPHGGDTVMQTKPQGNLGEPRWGLIQQ